MKTIIEMAEEVGALGYVRDSGEKPHQWIFTPKELERFAALVIANHPPQSFMTWQEGYASGMARERERFVEVLRQLHDSYSLASDSNAIRVRGQA